MTDNDPLEQLRSLAKRATADAVDTEMDGAGVRILSAKNLQIVNGGQTTASLHAALKHSLEGKPEPPLIDGYTWQQRFFLGWAQVWRDNIRPEALRMRVSNTHLCGSDIHIHLRPLEAVRA